MRKPRQLGMITGMALFLALNALGADKLSRPSAVGSIVGTTGSVLVDHQPVLPKETVFAGDSISTASGSGAFLNLHGTIAIVVENSEVILTRSGENVGLTLRKGAVEIRSGNTQPALVNVPGASIVVRSEGTFPSICRIAAVDQSAAVYTDRGRVEIHGKGTATLVRPGNTVRLEAGIPQAAGKQAGKVSGQVPTGSVQHNGVGTPVTLKLSDPIFWDDLVATQGNGRVRIALDGGSYLNIGARSQMRIVQHDAQSQQTTIELKLGTLRGEVVKLTKGGKFETRTPTAVIGVVGTIYLVNAGPKVTRVWSATGDVTVSNIDPHVLGTVVLHSGQSTTVRAGQPPSSPNMAPGNQVQTEMAQTNVQEGTVAGATGGEAATGGTAGGTTGGGTATAGGATTTGGGVTSTAGGATTTGGGAIGGFGNGINIGTVAAGGAGAIAGGVGIHEITTTSNSVKAAQNSLSAAAASAAAAQQAAAQALAAAQQVNNITTTTANAVNAILQGCGCVSPAKP